MQLLSVKISDVKRFWRYAQASDTRSYHGTPCIEWTGGKNEKGYGQFGTGSKAAGNYKNWRVHRWAYLVFVGDIPETLQYEHLCENEACVNVWEHCELVTNKENDFRKWYRLGRR
jgi:hypothetical protein